MLELKVDISGLKLKNPLILASGILGVTGGLLERVAREADLGAITTKTTTLKPKAGYPTPVIVSVKCGLVNAMGLPNPGVHAMADEIKMVRKTLEGFF